MSLYLNHYECPCCGEQWEDRWECQVNDECSTCGTQDIKPYDSEDLEENGE